MDRGAWLATDTKSQTQLSDFHTKKECLQLPDSQLATLYSLRKLHQRDCRFKIQDSSILISLYVEKLIATTQRKWQQEKLQPSENAKNAMELGKSKLMEPEDSVSEHFNAEQTPQNNFCRLAEDIRRPENQTIVFKNRGKQMEDEFLHQYLELGKVLLSTVVKISHRRS
ncbi:hypothetical protein MG293_000868 [Ovis ammon polii]|uniref:Uncharacterized protein n=1 Tax=Ovis ammon polii TaxID=230172 RepID=A0AAD4UJT9_OVIAM|nr:hypothetical protein MG293_000868 [Ovis ammon polii]